MTIVNGRKVGLSLDCQGFALFKRSGRDDEELVQDVTGAKRVVSCCDAIVRGDGDYGPLFSAHADCTEAYGENVLRQVFVDEADGLVKKRFAIFQVWRPLAPVEKNPLALVDYRTVSERDLLVARKKALFGEIYALAFSPTHSWFYFPDMEPDEAIVFKAYDSEKDGRARFTPHTAFEDPDSEVDAPERQSIDMRLFGFF